MPSGSFFFYIRTLKLVKDWSKRLAFRKAFFHIPFFLGVPYFYSGVHSVCLTLLIATSREILTTSTRKFERCWHSEFQMLPKSHILDLSNSGGWPGLEVV